MASVASLDGELQGALVRWGDHVVSPKLVFWMEYWGSAGHDQAGHDHDQAGGFQAEHDEAGTLTEDVLIP